MATYISKQSGLWSSATTWLTAAAGTLTPTADAGEPPQSNGNDRIVIRNNCVVTYNVNGIFGDDATNPTLPTNSTALNAQTTNYSISLSAGTLKASRSVSTSLTAKGSIFIGKDGYLDWGTHDDPIPENVNSTVFLNYSTSPATAKYGILMYEFGGSPYFLGTASFTACGSYRTKNTTLTSNTSANSTSITVAELSGWKVGDVLCLESGTSDITQDLLTTITNINENSVTIQDSLNNSRSIGTRVGNFSSNVTFTAWSSAFPTGIVMRLTPNGVYQFKNVAFHNTSSGNTINGANAVQHNGGIFIINPEYRNDLIFDSVSTLITSTLQFSYGMFYIVGPATHKIFLNNLNHRGPATAASILPQIRIGNGAFIEFNNCVGYRMSSINGLLNYVTGVTVNNCVFNLTQNCYAGYAREVVFDNCYFKTINTSFFNPGLIGKIEVNNCVLSGPDGIKTYFPSNGSVGDLIIVDSTITGGMSAAGMLRNELTTTKGACSVFDNDSLDYRKFNSYYYINNDSSQRKNSITSIRLKNELQTTNCPVYFSIPAQEGISQRLIFNAKYDQNYFNGLSGNLPTISFNGAGIDTTFTLASANNVWEKFDYSFTPTSTQDITITVTLNNTLTSGYVWFDGLYLDPYVKDIRHYGFVFEKTISRTVDPFTTLTENQVSAITTVNNLDHLYDVSNYWSVNSPSLTSYIDLYIKDGNILDFGSKHIVFNNSASTNFTYASASNTITIKTPLLSAGNNFIGLRTTGTISVSSNSNFSYIDIYGNINQQTPTSLSSVYMEGTLSYNTNLNTSIEYLNCSMDTVQNLGSGFITIKKSNSTISNGNDPEILDYVPTLLDIQNLNGGYIAIFDNTDTRQYYQNTDGVIVLPASTSGTWRYHVARYGYNFIQENFLVDGGTKIINPDYIPDSFVTGDSVTTAAYTDLNSTQKIYNYLSYYSTTSEGINYVPFYDKAFGSITINKNVTLNATAASVFNYNNGTNLITLKCSSINEDVLFVSSNNITYINGTTLSDDVRVRAANLDSELIMSGITSLTLYPTAQDRDDNTNVGEVLTGTIYRFLYGSITPLGVLLQDYIYNRVNVSGTILLNNTAISLGRNILQFETTGTLQQILNNQKTINIGIQKASKLIPHTTNI